MTRRAVLVCPGRGSYTPDDLGFLARRLALAPDRAGPIIESADRYRSAVDSPTVTELDGASRYSAAKHLAGSNAGPLIYTCSAVDAAIVAQSSLRTVAVVGNSMGWYTSLHVGGAFDFEAALRVVDVMSKTQGPRPLGGQLILPWTDADWQPDHALRGSIEEIVADVDAGVGSCGLSIELGGYLVLAGDDRAVAALKERLPKITVGRREYPFQLAQHAAFHTPLMASASKLGMEQLAHLDWKAPEIPCVDGAGRVRRRHATTPRGILDYTLVDQVLKPYDFTTSLRVALREFAPDVVVLLGPGDTLGGAIGQTLVMEGWNGIRSKADFVARQKSEEPVLLSLGREGVLESLLG